MSGRPTYSARMPLTIGFLALALLVGGIGAWSTRTQIAGAVIASGMIVVESNRQVVQHEEGGTVGALLARDGDHVAAGDVLLRLDDKLLQSELAVIDTQLVELRARRARLEAERDELGEVTFPEDLMRAAETRGDTAEQVAGQRALFAARLSRLDKEIGQIDERIAQTGNQIEGVEAQLEALSIQRDLIADELEDQESLLEKGLVQVQRVSALRREAARIAGEIGKLTADAAQFRGQIAGFEIEKLRLATTRQEEAITTLRDLQYRELELAEKRVGLSERIGRLELRAPVGGIVYGSTVFTVNSVVRAAEPLLYIVPQDQPLIVSARVDAIHIDQIHIGQEAALRFTSFNQRLTPEISGVVTDVSADVFEDEVTGMNYYRVELTPREEDLAKLDAQELLPGMPVETYLRTADRTPLSYLMKPLTDYFGRSMREG